MEVGDVQPDEEPHLQLIIALPEERVQRPRLSRGVLRRPPKTISETPRIMIVFLHSNSPCRRGIMSRIELEPKPFCIIVGPTRAIAALFGLILFPTGRCCPLISRRDHTVYIELEVEFQREDWVWLLVPIEPVDGPLGNLSRMDMRLQHRQARKREERQVGGLRWDGWRHNREKQQFGGVGFHVDIEFRRGRFFAWSRASRGGYQGVWDGAGHRGHLCVMINAVCIIEQPCREM